MMREQFIVDGNEDAERLLGRRNDTLYAETARHHGNFGKPTHKDKHGRNFRFENGIVLAYEIPLNVTRTARDNGEYIRHPEVDLVLDLIPVLPGHVPTRVEVTENLTQHKRKCGTCKYRLVKK